MGPSRRAAFTGVVSTCIATTVLHGRGTFTITATATRFTASITGLRRLASIRLAFRHAVVSTRVLFELSFATGGALHTHVDAGALLRFRAAIGGIMAARLASIFIITAILSSSFLRSSQRLKFGLPATFN